MSLIINTDQYYVRVFLGGKVNRKIELAPEGRECPITVPFINVFITCLLSTETV